MQAGLPESITTDTETNLTSYDIPIVDVWLFNDYSEVSESPSYQTDSRICTGISGVWIADKSRIDNAG
jgi:hypothetical protein